MLQKSLYLLIAGLLLAFPTFAQRNYVPGVLLLPGGDSLTGQIDYRKWDASPLSISFRDNGSATARDYAPASLKGFRISENQETWISVAATIDVTRETLDALSYSPERQTIGGAHFFREVMSGPVRLLLYTDKFHRPHFAMAEKDSVTQLVRKTVYISPDEGGSGNLQTHSFYRQQLMAILGNCMPARRLANLDYTEGSLRSALQQYAACRYPGQQVQVVRSGKDMRVSFGVMGGAGLNMYRFSGEHELAGGKSGSNVAPVAGVFLDVPLSRNRAKLSWLSEVVYTNRAFKTSWTKGVYENDAEVNYHYVQVQTLIKYTFPKGRLRPFANAGIAGAINLKGKDNWRQTSEYFQSDETKSALEGGYPFSMPVLVGAGVRYGRVHAELRASTLRDMSEYYRLRVSNTTLQLLVHYTLL